MAPAPETQAVRDAYDAIAELYTKLALDDRDRETPDRDWLARLAEIARPHHGPVADLGCGPGHVVDHLARLGLNAIGYDLSPALVRQARATFPDRDFQVGDITALDVDASSLGGIVSRYSLIHMVPDRLPTIFDQWREMLEPGAPVLVSFFAAPSVERHGSPFDHKVVTAFELFPATITDQLEAAGFADTEVGLRGPLGFERPLDHATVLARRRE